ncbi:MAG: hypothetical protein IIC39_07640 [Candidatus Marinimicrobia bacterium]|nr:hypothetical protein [Candidatus Neomarinimicrobiota bacterium]
MRNMITEEDKYEKTVDIFDVITNSKSFLKIRKLIDEKGDETDTLFYETIEEIYLEVWFSSRGSSFTG